MKTVETHQHRKIACLEEIAYLRGWISKEELMEMVEKTILLFRDQGVAGERFADTIARIGFDKACAMLEGNELLERKAEILAK